MDKNEVFNFLITCKALNGSVTNLKSDVTNTARPTSDL